MIVLRSTLYLAILVAITPFYFLLVFACAPLPRMARWKVIARWPMFATWLARHLLRIDYEVQGLENVPAEPCVILSKHSSAWETIAFTGIFPPHVYVIKRELLWLPFLGWGLGLYSPIAIDRSNRRAAMAKLVEDGRARFAQHFSIMIYPEGTRIAVGKRGTYRLGGANLATQLGARVLPVAHNAGVFWPRNAFLKFPGKVIVRIGEPIDTRGLAPDEVMRRVEDWIETQVSELVHGRSGVTRDAA
jgi:1-acyl-sn-glycerol-3-phosphate acyltransferase